MWSGSSCHHDCPASTSQSTNAYASSSSRPDGSDVTCRRTPLERCPRKTLVIVSPTLGDEAQRPRARPIAATCSGVEPQQPPTIRAPCSTYLATCSASMSGPASYTTSEPTTFGTPAFGLTHTGTSPAAARTSATTTSASASDRPQFAPTAATPSGTMVL